MARHDDDDLLLEQMRADRSWTKTTADYFSYVTIDREILERIETGDYDDNEIVQIMRCLARYCLTGEYPDYVKIQSRVVRWTLQDIIKNHDLRMSGELIKQYKKHLTQLEKRSGKKQDGDRGDSGEG